MTSLSAREAATGGVLLVEQSELGTLVVSGPDARTWLNGLLTCDVKTLHTGQGAWGLALSKQGKIQSELNLIVSDDRVYASTAAGTAGKLYDTFQEFLIMEDAELENRSTEFSWMMLHGPKAVAIAERASKEHGGHSAAIDWTGLGGAAIVIPRATLHALRASLSRIEGVVTATAEDWLHLRIEHLVPSFGVDYDTQDNPHQASLDRRAVSWTKGCYLGQEVVCMQDMRGKVKRRIVPLVADGSVEPGSPVTAAGERVGEITSASPDGTSGQTLALARITTKALELPGELRAGSSRLFRAKSEHTRLSVPS